ncbi:hypothetical protein PoB_005844700 [Plakobranchus ocellatus]|uniref:Uncharacterized protein n=1 Tax=Plakobranchus ocellatus TaxID=259542 RepID=A0AAV4CK80_9GAST|nr:hypothetical protein PoB_005844700 [Plakobranchus ocellatus]
MGTHGLGIRLPPWQAIPPPPVPAPKKSAQPKAKGASSTPSPKSVSGIAKKQAEVLAALKKDELESKEEKVKAKPARRSSAQQEKKGQKKQASAKNENEKPRYFLWLSIKISFLKISLALCLWALLGFSVGFCDGADANRFMCFQMRLSYSQLYS